MAYESSKGARQLLIGRSADWIKRFDVQEYVSNPPLIEKLYEEKQLALLDVSDLRERLEHVNSELGKLRLDNQSLRLLSQEGLRWATRVFVLSLLSLLLVGLGINLATSNPRNWIGWVMIGLGCLAEIIAFVSRPRRTYE